MARDVKGKRNAETEELMRRCKALTMTAVLLLCAVRAVAADFSVPLAGGQTLYFNVVSGGVEVVYPRDTQVPAQGWNGYVRPTGALVIPSTVEHAGQVYSVVAVSNHAFYNCTGLTSVTLGEGIAEVRSNGFGLCSGLTAIDLPTTLDSLGQSAFFGCNALATCTVRAAVPPRCHSAAFYNVPLQQAVLHVPCGCVAAYGASAPWSSFGTVSDEGCSVTVGTGVNNLQRGSVSGGGDYAEGTAVTLTATPAVGCFFACWGDGDTLNPRVVTATAGACYVAHFFPYVHDTLLVVQRDTIEVHDTVRIYSGGTDTLYVVLHDTVRLTDTVHPTLVTLTLASSDPWRGIVVGNATVPMGTEIEAVAIPMDGDAFYGWSDGSYDNPRRISVDGDMVLTAFFGEYEGIDAAGGDGAAWSATVSGRTLTVHCGVGEMVRLFDMQGRSLLSVNASSEATTMMVPAAGAYLVSVGTAPAKRILIE